MNKLYEIIDQSFKIIASYYLTHHLSFPHFNMRLNIPIIFCTQNRLSSVPQYSC